MREAARDASFQQETRVAQRHEWSSTLKREEGFNIELSRRVPSVSYTKMVDDEVRKRGSSRCVSSQPAAEQLLIAHSSKPSRILHIPPLAFPLHAALNCDCRCPCCFSAARGSRPPSRLLLPMPLPHAAPHVRRNCRHPDIRLHALRLLLPPPYDTWAATCYFHAVRLLLFSRCMPTCVVTSVLHLNPYSPRMMADI